MNRSLTNVIFGSYADLSSGPVSEITGEHTESTIEQVVDMMANAKDIIVVPG